MDVSALTRRVFTRAGTKYHYAMCQLDHTNRSAFLLHDSWPQPVRPTWEQDSPSVDRGRLKDQPNQSSFGVVLRAQTQV